MAGVSPAIPVSEFFVTATGINITVSPTPIGYYAFVKLKRLVFFVTGLELSYQGPIPDDWPNPVHVVHDRRAVKRLWPPSESVVEWPPPARLESDDLDNLVQIQP
jgi:hypothetical protein